MYFNTVAKPIIKHLEQEIASSKVKVHIHFTTNGYLLNSRLINYLKGKSKSDRKRISSCLLAEVSIVASCVCKQYLHHFILQKKVRLNKKLNDNYSNTF